MTYSYDYLANRAINGTSIGKWKGTDVIPISKNEFEKLFEKSNGKMNSNFYLIFDNGMKIVKDNRVYATMDRNGNIAEQDVKFVYYTSKVVAAASPAADSSTSGMDYDMSSMLDDIDRLLKEVCTWQD